MFKLIKNGTLYAPEELGAKDILIHGEKIIKTDDRIKPPNGFDCETIDASGKIIYPGFIDGHVHLIGADDGQGPMGRTSDIAWKDIVESGTTTVVGCLGSSRFVRSLHSLYIKTLELDMMGLSTYMYTGSFVIPPPTLTGEIRKDIYLIPKVIGLKTAISDATTNHHTWRDLAAITSEVLYGADIANKHAVTHVHVGKQKTRMDRIFELIENTGINPAQVIPTHINRRDPDVITQAVEYTKMGGIVDLSSLMRKEEGTLTGLKPDLAVKRMLDEGAVLENMTMSSDGNVPQPICDENRKQIGRYIAPLDLNRREVRDIANNGVCSFSDALKIMTTNPAKALGIKKGRVAEGYDADLVIANDIQNMRVEQVFSRGNLLVRDGEAVWKTHFQRDPYYNLYH
ncbi:beta-aspartyl-peptidase [Candidatus Bathyarchaeota archaeon]|nr:MAG: beta-aspartyl-peptidase [Candidatus Bathyarchaeota archaeon]